MKTTNLNLATRWLDRMPLPPALTITILVLACAAGISAANRLGARQQAAAMPTPALDPIIIIASPLPQGIPPTAVPAAQVATVLPNALRRAVVAYDSPNGSVIGAIEQGRAYQVLARFGNDWLQTDVTGSGVVWLRSADVLDLPADLADLQPPPVAPQPQVVYQPVYIASQPEQAAPTIEPSAPPPTMAPQTAAILDRNQWALDAQRAGK